MMVAGIAPRIYKFRCRACFDIIFESYLETLTSGM